VQVLKRRPIPCRGNRSRGTVPFGRRGTGTFFGPGRSRKRTPGEPKNEPVPRGL
jgi:hypothetical protein